MPNAPSTPSPCGTTALTLSYPLAVRGFPLLGASGAPATLAEAGVLAPDTTVVAGDGVSYRLLGAEPGPTAGVFVTRVLKGPGWATRTRCPPAGWPPGG